MTNRAETPSGSTSGRPRHRIPIALYPMVLAAAFVTELFVVSGISPFAILRALSFATVAALALSVIGRAVFRDRDRGGVAAVLGVLLLSGGADSRVVAAVGLGYAFLMFEMLATRRRPAIRWWMVGRAMTAVAAIFALAVGIKAVQSGTVELMAEAVSAEVLRGPDTATPIAQADRPDIYLILLDGYARRDVIEDVFHADGSSFVDGLEGRGFAVSDKSRSNYAATSLTLTSVFAMQPFQDVDSLKPLVDGNASRPAGALIHEAINDATALRVLRDLGYEVHAISSGFEEPSLRRADVWIDTGQVNEFEMVLLRRSFLSTVIRTVAPDLVSAQYRDRINGVLHALETEASRPHRAPRFVFGHVPSPHAPWVYNADGTLRTALEFDTFYSEAGDATMTDEELQAAYIGQATWLGREVLRTVDRIVAESDSPPLIVLFSDHGTWIGAHGIDVRRRFRTLLAARTPDGSALYPEEVATVDLFPIMLAHVAGISVPTHSGSPSYMTGPGAYDFYAIPDPNDPRSSQ